MALRLKITPFPDQASLPVVSLEDWTQHFGPELQPGELDVDGPVSTFESQGKSPSEQANSNSLVIEERARRYSFFQPKEDLNAGSPVSLNLRIREGR